MRVDRLTVLRDFLRDHVAKLSSNRFDMDLWWVGPENQPESCGTAGCMLGWACQIPEFKEAGLQLDAKGYPKFRGSYGGTAGRFFFEIEDSSIFYPSCYSGSVEGDGRVPIGAVIAKLDGLIKQGMREDACDE